MSYREDDVGKVQTMRDYVLNDLWWDKVAYILRFTRPIYEMLRVANMDAPILHKVYEMWDSMIENVKKHINMKKTMRSLHSMIWYTIYSLNGGLKIAHHFIA